MNHSIQQTNADSSKFEELARSKWNASADEHNQWDNLGNDEKESLIALARQGGVEQSSEGAVATAVAPAAGEPSSTFLLSIDTVARLSDEAQKEWMANGGSPTMIFAERIARTAVAGQTELRSIIERVRDATKSWPGAWTGTIADLDRALELLGPSAPAADHVAQNGELEKESVALDEDGLLPLPEPTWCDCNPRTSHVYPLDQVRTIRREAVAAAIEPHMVRCDEMRDALSKSKQEVAALQEQLAEASASAAKACQPAKEKAPAYCKACQEVGMSNCGNFDECDGATCSTCHRPLNVPLTAPAAAVKDEWHDVSELPPTSDDVLVELKPKRKGSKPRYAIAAYCRTEKGVHEAEPGWFDTNSEDVDVVRWKFIDATKPTSAPAATFQRRVKPWMMACFGPKISADKSERNHRFFEEAAELVQACGMSQSDAHLLVDYVYNRPAGEPAQEVGGVMITLAALCLARDIDMHEAGEVELARIWTKVEAIRKKQATKPKNSPLPTGSAVADALPYAQHLAWMAALDEAAKICDAEDGPHRMVAGYCADRIRALKEGPQAAQASAALYKAIMALPYDDSRANEEYSDRRSAYGAGHLDGRRAVATLVSPRGAAQTQMVGA